MRTIAVAVAVIASACGFDARDGAVWIGGIVRDGTPVEFVGYDPYPTQGSFGSSPTALGYIAVDDQTLLVKISLEIVEIGLYVSSRPSQLEIKDRFNTGEFGMGLTYVEQVAADVDAIETDQPFRQAYLEGHGGTTTGTFTVTDTDYDTYIVGVFDAVLVHPTGGRRELHMDVRWLGQE